MSNDPQKTYIEPDLAEFLSRRMRDISARLNSHLLGTIASFNPVKQTVTVDIAQQKIIKNVIPVEGVQETSDQVINYPTLVDVPIVIMQGGGGYLTFPIAIGDSCIIMFCDRDMDIWLQTAQVAPPNSDRVHDINDAIALVGIRNFTNPIESYDPNKVVLAYPGGLVSVPDRTGERLSQSGFLQPYAGNVVPSGWLLCYGQAVNRTTYADLFAVIGTIWGSGDGSTTFNVPDLRGRTIAGLDNMGGSDANVLTNTFNPNRNTLGGSTGQESHQLTIPELAIHNHLTVPNYTSSDGGGYDELTARAGNNNGPPHAPVTIDFAGGDQPHQNVQPTAMINWIIKI